MNVETAKSSLVELHGRCGRLAVAELRIYKKHVGRHSLNFALIVDFVDIALSFSSRSCMRMSARLHVFDDTLPCGNLDSEFGIDWELDKLTVRSQLLTFCSEEFYGTVLVKKQP